MPLALSARVTGRLTLALAAAFVAFAAGITGAEARFEVVDQAVITGTSGMRLISLRDNMLKNCYLVFVVDGPGQADGPARVEPADIPSAVATRDRRLADLLHGFDQERGAIPGTIIPNPLKYDWQAESAQFEFALTVLANEFSRLEQRIERAGESRMAMTALPAPCTPASTPAAERAPETRR
jgi:hypothetical protein